MAVKRSPTLKSAQAQVWEDTLAGGSLVIYDGAEPADEAAALSGNTALATFPLGADFMNAAVDGVQALSAALTDADGVDAGGVASFYRFLDSGGAAQEQGSVGSAGSGEDMELQNTSLAVGQAISITSWQNSIATAAA